jgi:CBS domain-containing protein
MYQIKVEAVMTRDVICFPPSAPFRRIQRCLKERRFSGTPIVDNGLLVGMVSIDDIITAFDKGYIDEPVEGRMARNVLTVPAGYSVISACNLFEKHGYGRLPVVARPQCAEVVGIVTYGDILSHLVLAVNRIAERAEEQQNVVEDSVRNARELLHFELAADDFELAGIASTTIKKQLKVRGIPPRVLRRIAVICYEAEINVIVHSLGGYMEVRVLDDRVEIRAVDEGPGIPDVERAMQEGYTTANEKIRALGFGAGMGLCNIKRCADEFQIRSSMETGTELEAVVLLPGENSNGCGGEQSVDTQRLAGRN